MTQLITTFVLILLVAGLVVSIRRKRKTSAAMPHPRVRDDVRITVYRPASVVAEQWYELLVYAHRAEGPTAEGGWQPDLSARVAQAAAAELGDLMPRYRRLRRTRRSPSCATLSSRSSQKSTAFNSILRALY